MADRPFWLMMAPMMVLMLLSLMGAHTTGDVASRAAAGFMQPDNAAILAHRPAEVLQMTPQEPGTSASWLSVVLALAIAGFGLSRRALPRALVLGTDWSVTPILDDMQAIHSAIGIT